ncbi:MAG: hypothetical protein JO265_01925 [Acidimicrobiia bacterium]|nr:hypothetical protein [Acidimicrobiia bacterium]
MRMNPKTQALLVVAVPAIAVLVFATQAVGVVQSFATARGRHFVSTPHQAAFGHIPNTLDNRSVSPCPAGGESVTVAFIQGTTTLASASTTSNAKGHWAVSMAIPHNLAPGTYGVTANCTGTAPLSYRSDTFHVFTPQCPSGTTTSTTMKCHVPPTTSST